jgi:hypothetical protein
MLNKIVEKAKGFLQRPEAAFSSEKTTDPMDGFIYMAVLSLVSAILAGAIVLSPLAIVEAYIFGIVFIVIAGLWLHLWALIVGAKGGLKQTLKAVFYGGTPGYLLGWIPYIGILFSLWSLYLEWMGLKVLHEMSGDKAALSIVIAIVIPAIIALVLLLTIGLFVMNMVGLSPFMGPGF